MDKDIYALHKGAYMILLESSLELMAAKDLAGEKATLEETYLQGIMQSNGAIMELLQEIAENSKPIMDLEGRSN